MKKNKKQEADVQNSVGTVPFDSYYFKDVPADKVEEVEKKERIARSFTYAAMVIATLVCIVLLVTMFSGIWQNFEGLLKVMAIILAFDLIFAIVGAKMDSSACKDARRLGYFKDNLFHSHGYLSHITHLYNACMDAVSNYQCIEIHELQDALPEYSSMDCSDFRSDLEMVVSCGWFCHGAVIGDMLCITEAAADYYRKQQEEERKRREAEEAANSPNRHIVEQEWELFAQNKRPEVSSGFRLVAL